MSTSSVSRESDKFMLRFPDGMRDEIAKVAKTNGRSMNAEIIDRLQKSFEFDDVFKPPLEGRKAASIEELTETLRYLTRQLDFMNNQLLPKMEKKQED